MFSVLAVIVSNVLFHRKHFYFPFIDSISKKIGLSRWISLIPSWNYLSGSVLGLKGDHLRVLVDCAERWTCVLIS